MKVMVKGLGDVTPASLGNQIVQTLEQHIEVSEPWYIAKVAVLPNGESRDSRQALRILGFLLEESEGDLAYGELFYIATTRPAKWTREYSELDDVLVIRDETGKAQLYQAYDLERKSAQVVIADGRPMLFGELYPTDLRIFDVEGKSDEDLVKEMYEWEKDFKHRLVDMIHGWLLPSNSKTSKNGKSRKELLSFGMDLAWIGTKALPFYLVKPPTGWVKTLDGDWSEYRDAEGKLRFKMYRMFDPAAQKWDSYIEVVPAE